MSDVDYRNAYYGIPEAEIAAKQEEEAREQRWAEFVGHIRSVLRDPGSEYAKDDPVEVVMARYIASYHVARKGTRRVGIYGAFAETEGWDGALNAIARAMREEAQFRKELVDRR